VNEYVKKIAYFYHASIQGAGPYPGAAETIRLIAEGRRVQGFLADAQCFTPGPLQWCMRQDDPDFDVNRYFPPSFRVLSADKRTKKPSDVLFKAAVQALGEVGIRPGEVLHIGSSVPRDIAPAKKHGFRTALFAGDKNSLVATPEQLKDPATRP